MTNSTERGPKALKAAYSNQDNDERFQARLEEYLQKYDSLFRTKPQRRLFRVFIRGLLSPLERKSVEPIALSFLGEDGVRCLQQFLTRSSFDTEGILREYQKRLSAQIDSEGGMLSVENAGFIKKGKHSIGVKRQYCARLGKTENCQIGVFLAYAGDRGYGLADYDLYVPQEWYDEAHAGLRKRCRLPDEKTFSTKNEIALRLLNHALESGLFHPRWVGCDAAYGNDHAFLDGLALPEQVWYFAEISSTERVFLTFPEITYPETKSGRPGKYPVLSNAPVSVQSIAEDAAFPWETAVPTEGAAERKLLRCFACRNDQNRGHVKPGDAIWLYLRKYAGGEIKYFVSNAPKELRPEELDRAETMRRPVEQCFEECKSNLGMTHYECRSYPGWMRHMLFVLVAHLFTTQIRTCPEK